MSADVIDKPKVEVNEAVETPSDYGVVFHNDDVTPMDFVTALIYGVFSKTPEESYEIMMKIHNEGKAIVEIYCYEIAVEMKNKCDYLSKKNNQSLVVTVEEI